MYIGDADRMYIRMRWFRCSDCNESFEEVCSQQDLVMPCPKCGKSVPLDPDYSKQIHRDGNHYRHVSWSIDNASR